MVVEWRRAIPLGCVEERHANGLVSFSFSVSPLLSSLLFPSSLLSMHAGAGGPAPEELIERTETDAAVYLTVYPYNGLEILNVTHYTDLGNQILNCEWQEVHFSK